MQKNIVRLFIDFESDYGGVYREEIFLPIDVFNTFKDAYDFEFTLNEFSGKHSEDYVDVEVDYFSEADMADYIFDNGYYNFEYLFDYLVEIYELDEDKLREYEAYLKGLGKLVTYEVILDKDHVEQLEHLAETLGFTLTRK